MPGFVESCDSSAAPAGSESPSWTIEEISLAGDTACARVVNQRAGESFRDSLTLLHHDGKWRIVARVFYHLGE
ncbi:nuclear transport factor 2 family protein [Defluviimonas sp. WL0002]|uniref:Nuclear transport factor 2 family protein n=1 Tax=Albidovulum marisflavi TaxID=2984159 RepID=A0ABT2ZHE1_9RHOB|nr:nuclear transport factor 2 family protein [Defluviimonas sp. WL0002]MCV2870537.1 nuclear transport factor 2 family protein [Defluviimonas sp. WL0002]